MELFLLVHRNYFTYNVRNHLPKVTYFVLKHQYSLYLTSVNFEVSLPPHTPFRLAALVPCYPCPHHLKFCYSTYLTMFYQMHYVLLGFQLQDIVTFPC